MMIQKPFSHCELKTVERRSPTLVILALMGATIATTGCFESVPSEDVSKDAIFQNYDVTYDAEESKLTANASYGVGGSMGTTVELVDPSRVLFEGRAMKADRFLGVSYRSEIKGKLAKQSFEFEWIAQDGVSYRNRLAVKSFTVASDPVASASQRIIRADVQASADQTEGWSMELAWKDGGTHHFCSLSAERRGSRVEAVWSDESCGASLDSRRDVDVRVLRSQNVELQAVTKEGGWGSSTYRSKKFDLKWVN